MIRKIRSKLESAQRKEVTTQRCTCKEVIWPRCYKAIISLISMGDGVGLDINTGEIVFNHEFT